PPAAPGEVGRLPTSTSVLAATIWLNPPQPVQQMSPRPPPTRLRTARTVIETGRWLAMGNPLPKEEGGRRNQEGLSDSSFLLPPPSTVPRRRQQPGQVAALLARAPLELDARHPRLRQGEVHLLLADQPAEQRAQVGVVPHDGDGLAARRQQVAHQLLLL